VALAFRTLCLLLALAAMPFGCRSRGGDREVVVYCSLDEPYARPILERSVSSS
jgi:hypothetical protein